MKSEIQRFQIKWENVMVSQVKRQMDAFVTEIYSRVVKAQAKRQTDTKKEEAIEKVR
jgi:hypothetical protein